MQKNVCKLPQEVVELMLKEGFPGIFFVPWGVYVLLEAIWIWSIATDLWLNGCMIESTKQ